jgi:hypothetical protein
MAASVDNIVPGKRYDAGDDLAAPTSGGGIPLGMGGGGTGIGSLLKLTRTLLPLLALGLATASCSNEDPGGEAPTPAPEPTEKLVTLTVNASAGAGADATTRTDYDDSGDKTDGTGYDGIEVTWHKEMQEFIGAVYYTGEGTITPVGNDGSGLPYLFEGTGNGTKSMSFTGTIPTSTENKYSFYYPALKSAGASWSSSLSYDLTGQTQDGDGNTAHLKDFDVMYTPQAVTATTGGTSDANPFQFKHAAALLRFDFTLPEAATITRIEVAVAVNSILFYDGLSLTFNADGSITSIGNHQAEKLTLSINNDNGGNTLRAYLMVAPTTKIKGYTLQLTAYAGEVKGYTTTAAIGNGDDDGFLAGKTYTFVRDADDFTPVDAPVFAGSNIYWDDEHGILTFDDTGILNPSGRYQGVSFKFGSLVGISASDTEPVNSITVYQPKNPAPSTYTWEKTTASYADIAAYHTVGIIGNPFRNYFVELGEEAEKALYEQSQGDICRYLTLTGAAPAGSSWRMPTAYELNKAGNMDNLWTLTGDAFDTFATKSGTSADGKTALPSILYNGTTSLPASGWRPNFDDYILSNQGYEGIYLSAVPEGDSRAWRSDFSANNQLTSSGIEVSHSLSVRCVKEAASE